MPRSPLRRLIFLGRNAGQIDTEFGTCRAVWYDAATLNRGFQTPFVGIPGMASPQGVIDSSVLSKQRSLELVNHEPARVSLASLRIAFWSVGVILASVQAWIFRYEVSADSISYFDMSDGVLHGYDWHRLINGMYSGLYPLLLGVFRGIFQISPGNEIAAAHLFGVVLFIFAFVCFEFFLAAVVRQLESQDQVLAGKLAFMPLPTWAFVSIAYCVFLWSAIEHISLIIPRADMLLSGFFYLAAGLVLRMQNRPARWSSYLALGTVLGIGILAKEAMLPIGALLLAATILVVENWRPALKMASAAAALMFVIGCLYFVPLSMQRGHFTLGEAGHSVYTVNVDEASPHWYLQSVGSAKGSFLHPPQKIFSQPPAYFFAFPTVVTEPLRFDQSYWLAGVRPRFVLRRELTAVKSNIHVFEKLFRELGVVLGTILVLAFLCASWKQVTTALLRAWPVWLMGLAGCAMYAAIVVESRYVVAFLTLFCLGILVGLPVPAEFGRKIAQLVVVATVILLLVPIASHIYGAYAPHRNESLEAAQGLEALGIKAGDPVARISPSNSELTVERILRVEIVAEVDHTRSSEFWSAPVPTQEALLQTFAGRGVKAVIATSPVLNGANQSEWLHLGSTQYWAWLPSHP